MQDKATVSERGEVLGLALQAGEARSGWQEWGRGTVVMPSRMMLNSSQEHHASTAWPKSQLLWSPAPNLPP